MAWQVLKSRCKYVAKMGKWIFFSSYIDTHTLIGNPEYKDKNKAQ